MHGVESQPKMVDVQVVPLDEALADEPEISLLKVDVQGFEREVLLGAVSTLKRCKCLLIEVMYDRDYYAGAEVFLGLARQIEEQSPLRLSCVSEPAMNVDGLGMWADAVFVKPG
jgi:hypothetical protein